MILWICAVCNYRDAFNRSRDEVELMRRVPSSEFFASSGEAGSLVHTEPAGTAIPLLEAWGTFLPFGKTQVTKGVEEVAVSDCLYSCNRLLTVGRTACQVLCCSRTERAEGGKRQGRSRGLKVSVCLPVSFLKYRAYVSLVLKSKEAETYCVCMMVT